MNKLIALVLIAFLLLASGCAAPGSQTATPPGSASPSVSPSASASPSPSMTPSASPSPVAAPSLADYFPFTPDVHMVYLGTGMEYAGFNAWTDFAGSNTVQQRTNNGGTESVSVYTIDGGALKKVFQQGETYYVYDFTGMDTMEEVLIMEPIAVGTTWTLDGGEERAITKTNAAVTVPYGSYTGVLEVTTTYDESVTTDYYAPGVGLIKRVFTMETDPANPVTSELETVEASTPYTTMVRSYYPDFNNSQLVYINQDVPFDTNDDVASKFEDIFKNVPTGSGLTPVMSADAMLGSLTFDTASGIVTADVSREFITGMVAGAQLEGMILESLANTLGRYFQTDKVQVTVDGGPYESGHFLFNPGDILPYDPNAAAEYTQ